MRWLAKVEGRSRHSPTEGMWADLQSASDNGNGYVDLRGRIVSVEPLKDDAIEHYHRLSTVLFNNPALVDELIGKLQTHPGWLPELRQALDL